MRGLCSHCRVAIVGQKNPVFLNLIKKFKYFKVQRNFGFALSQSGKLRLLLHESEA